MTIQTPASEWRLTTLGGIPVKVKERHGVFEDEHAEAQETYIIRSNRLLDFVQESFPDIIPFFGGVFYTRARELPGLPTLVTKKISWKTHVDGRPVDPFGTDPSAAVNTYEGDVEVVIDYAPIAYNDQEMNPADPMTFLEISANASGEFLHVPLRGAARWEAGGGDAAEEVTEINVPNVIIQPEVEWTVSWPRVPFSTFTATILTRLRERLGTVNAGPMLLFRSAPAETVMLVGWSMKQVFTWKAGFTGAAPVQLEMKFVEKNFISPDGVQVTHNHFYRPGHGFRRLLVDGSRATYNTSNLDFIFAPQ